MRRRRTIKAILFTCLLLLVLGGLTKLFIPKWIVGTSSTYVTEGVYQEKKNSIDVCFIGSSQVIYGISSMRLLEKYGISTYSCATGEQPMIISYFYLKELRKNQKYSTVVLDCSMLFEDEVETRFRSTIDSAPWSMNKLETIRAYCNSSEDTADISTYLFPIINYHSRWNEIKPQDFKYRAMNNDIFKGGNLTAEVDRNLTAANFDVDLDEMSDDKMDESQVYWFDKIANYCKENNIELILVKTPKESWNKTKMLQTEELAQKYELPFYDFNTGEMLQKMNFVANEDMWNRDHLNIRGADKVTDFIAENYLSGYIDTSGEKLKEYDQEKVRKYDQKHDIRYMQSTYSVDEILGLLKNDKYDVFVAKSGDVSDLWTESMQNQWTGFNALTDIRTLNGSNYVAHISGGNVVYENVSPEALDYEYQLSKDRTIQLKSVQAGAEILYRGEQVKYHNTGLYFFVYDHDNQEIIDRFTIFYNPAIQALDIYHVGVYKGQE